MKGNKNHLPKKASFPFAILLCIFLAGCEMDSFSIGPFTITTSTASAAYSDEDMIRARITTFTEAYNNGDLDEVLNSFATRPGQQIRSTINVAQNCGGSLLQKTIGVGSGLQFSDLFRIGTAMMTEGDLITIEISEIKIEEKSAIANGSMTYREKAAFNSDIVHEETANIQVILVKEKSDWYIQDIQPLAS